MKLAGYSWEVPIKSMVLWIRYCIQFPVIKLNNSKSPYVPGKKCQIWVAGWLASYNLWMWLKWTFWLDELANYFPEGLKFFNFFCAIWHGWQVHKVVFGIISYSRHTCRNQGNQRSLFLENTELFERKNLNIRRELASYNKSYLDISLYVETCRLLFALDFPLTNHNNCNDRN